MEREERFMRLALQEAEQAMALGEVPVGAVIVRGDEVVSMGHNLRETGKNALAHAEIIAINRACQALGGWRLHQCELYVTLEPCPMCSGAIINSRIQRVVYGAADDKAGCMGSVADFCAYPFNHKPQVVAGCWKRNARPCFSSFSNTYGKKEKLPSGRLFTICSPFSQVKRI